MLEELKAVVCQANKSLVKHGLVRWTSGNVSAVDPATNFVVIKPSGVDFDTLTAEMMVVVDLNGNIIEGNLKPSVDTASHLYVYRHRKDILSITHTHSPYATSFAIRGESIPIYTTTSAAMFGQEVKCSGFARIGEEEIGSEIVELIGDNCAILIRNHGVFTVGSSVEKSVKSAVLLEETAEAVYLAKVLGPIEPLAEDVISAGYAVYHSNYGQN